MTIIEICKKNALIYSKEICKTKEGSIFPAYVDWADHIATENTIDYEYHLNKTVADLEKLLKIFKPIFPGFVFSDWEEDWYVVSISSAWIHDIGMIVDRENHGLKSAELIIKNNDPQFNLGAVRLIPKI